MRLFKEFYQIYSPYQMCCFFSPGIDCLNCINVIKAHLYGDDRVFQSVVEEINMINTCSNATNQTYSTILPCKTAQDNQRVQRCGEFNGTIILDLHSFQRSKYSIGICSCCSCVPLYMLAMNIEVETYQYNSTKREIIF